MTLRPTERAAWQGFLDMLRPPAGYRVKAAIGTSYGVSFDTLFAALLAMLGTDHEEARKDPVACWRAVRQLTRRVRVIVHPGTIRGPGSTLSDSLVAMTDQVVREVRDCSGLFHPKLWLLRFESEVGRDSERLRLIVGSRNLVMSRAFELGIALEGRFRRERSRADDKLAGDLSSALRDWTRGMTLRSKAVNDLLRCVKDVVFDRPQSSSRELRLRWQGTRSKSAHAHIPKRVAHALVASPFLETGFLRDLAKRAGDLTIVSRAEAFADVDRGLLADLQKRAGKRTWAFIVGELGDAQDTEIVDGIHAKLLLVECEDGSSYSWVGSANATSQGWGRGLRNAEAMLEMQPGLSIATFRRDFLTTAGGKPPAWVRPFDIESPAAQPSDDEKMRHKLVIVLRTVAQLGIDMRYDKGLLRLELTQKGQGYLRSSELARDVDVRLAPWTRSDGQDGWQPALAGPASHPVQSADLSAYVRLKAQCDGIALRRIALGDLVLSEQQIQERDEKAIANAWKDVSLDKALQALVPYTLQEPAGTVGPGPGKRKPGPSRMYSETRIESLMLAVARDPDVARLIETVARTHPDADDPFRAFCKRLRRFAEPGGERG